MKHNASPPRNSGARRHGGFTLLQLLVVVGLITLLSAVLMGQFGRSRAAVRRAECDVHLKEIVLAMDTYRQEHGRLPKKVLELKDKGYLPLDTLRCSADPDLGAEGHKASYSSYTDYYVLRDALDDGELPIIVCPFHEKDGLHGAQGIKAGYTKSFAARPATLSGIAGAVTVTRPGEGVLAIPASGQLAVRGGDRIKVGSGTAQLTFADGSAAALAGNSEMSVLESYQQGQTKDTLYTIVRQFAGSISYSVVPGNKFDVATPTATAGALGTRFTITISSNPIATLPPVTTLNVTEHSVAFTVEGRTIEIPAYEDVAETVKTPPVVSNDPKIKEKEHKPRDNKNKKDKENK